MLKDERHFTTNPIWRVVSTRSIFCFATSVL